MVFCFEVPRASLIAQLVKNPPAMREIPDPGIKPSLIPESGRSTGEGIGYPLQYSCASLVAQLVSVSPQCGNPGLEHWVGKILWRRERLLTPVFWPGEFHGVAKSGTCLSNFHFHLWFPIHILPAPVFLHQIHLILSVSTI